MAAEVLSGGPTPAARLRGLARATARGEVPDSADALWASEFFSSPACLSVVFSIVCACLESGFAAAELETAFVALGGVLTLCRKGCASCSELRPTFMVSAPVAV
jgi:hypothetical protein